MQTIEEAWGALVLHLGSEDDSIARSLKASIGALAYAVARCQEGTLEKLDRIFGVTETKPSE